MAKEEDKKKAGKGKAGNQEPEKPEVAEIETVEELEIYYPQLVTEIRDSVMKDIGKCTGKQVKENMPGLYERIVADVKSKGGPDLKVPGFLLDVDDPVAGGTLRAYQRLKGIDGLRLPYVLPYKDKATKTALEDYILRADGSGDNKRAEAARMAMEKCK